MMADWLAVASHDPDVGGLTLTVAAAIAEFRTGGPYASFTMGALKDRLHMGADMMRKQIEKLQALGYLSQLHGAYNNRVMAFRLICPINKAVA